jgi:hypothetical protein
MNTISILVAIQGIANQAAHNCAKTRAYARSRGALDCAKTTASGSAN